MDTIKITNDRNEMCAIGRTLFQEKRDIYTAAMVNGIKTTIQNSMPNSTDAEREKMFYCSIYDYWVYGNNISEEFYYHFDKLTHEEKKEYITFRERYDYIFHLNKKEDVPLLKGKYKAYELLSDHYFRDVAIIRDINDFDIFNEFVEKHPIFVVKPSDLALGIGVHKEDISKYSSKEELFNKILNEGIDNQSKYKWGGAASIVLEELIQQDESLAAFHRQSVNVIRITTVYLDDEVHLFWPWLKVGVGGDFLASCAQNGLGACIDGETGVICTDAFVEDGTSTKNHPESHIVFKGFQIPQWKELVKLVTMLAKRFPTLRYLGWDMALTPKGWCIVEVNWAGEFLWQGMIQRGTKREIEDLLRFKPTKNFWWEK